MVRHSAVVAARRGHSARRNPQWKRSLQFGVPFVVFLLGGTYGMGQVLDLKFERIDTRVVKQSERQYELKQEHEVRVSPPSISAATHPPSRFGTGDDGAPDPALLRTETHPTP